jgi:hypothetical protein
VAWVKFDDAFYRHEKRWELDLDAIGLFVLMLCYANDKLTDGFVPDRFVDSNLSRPRTSPLKQLLAAEMLLRCEGGYQIVDYLRYQPSREQVLKRRAERSEAGRRGAAAKHGKAGNSHGSSYGNSHGSPPSITPSSTVAPFTRRYRDEASRKDEHPESADSTLVETPSVGAGSSASARANASEAEIVEFPKDKDAA